MARTVSSRRASTRGKVVGLGHIAQAAILPAFKHAAQNSRLVALVSGDEKKRSELARHYRVDRTYPYEQYDECVAATEVDAVYITVPNSLHAEFAVPAPERTCSAKNRLPRRNRNAAR